MGRGNHLFAARYAGYGKAKDGGQSNNRVVSVTAVRLLQRDDVQLAIKEESQRRLRLLPPAALQALEALIHTPAHRDHYRAVQSIVDRVSPPSQTIAVHHTHETVVTPAMVAEVEAKIAALAQKAGVLLPTPPPVIEGEFKEVEPA